MSEPDTGRPDPEPDDGGGLEVEKWILRIMMLGVVVLGVVAIGVSIDDIKRYWRIRQM